MDARQPERTGFQEHAPYAPEYDLRTDFVMVYGIDESLPERITAWRERGYRVHLMTGVSWGHYEDYLDGAFDGRKHWDEAQQRHSGERIMHGPTVPYMVPTVSFADYLAVGIRRGIDAGVDAIHLEEPEFWADAGYSPAFQREWEIYYGEPWQPPHTAPDHQYRSAKLKQYLYTRCLDRLCAAMKEYAKVQYGRDIKFYVPTHSLINYTQWRIVSPESRLIDLPACNGYIAQIWTGTSRTPNVYCGQRKERTFETAFLEYGVMQELVRDTGRRMWFLHDPVEDNPRHSWSDYRRNYLCTLVASLLHPAVSHYEVCPWPRRVFLGEYPREEGQGKERIPGTYATALLTVMNALRDLDGQPCEWPQTTDGVGILLADSAMYQRAEPAFSLAEDGESTGSGDAAAAARAAAREAVRDWSAFYGLALPLVKHGVPVRPAQLDNIRRFPGYLDPYRVLFLSYEFQKPEWPDLHFVLGQWVQQGGVLIYVGDGSDPFHGVREWWNQGKHVYRTPAEHLFESLGLGPKPDPGLHRVGNGAVILGRRPPAMLAATAEGARQVREWLQAALRARGETDYHERSYFLLRRGPYVVAAAMDEFSPDTAPEREECAIPGRFVDLFSADLSILTDVKVPAGSQAFLLDLQRAVDGAPKVLASASRVEDLQIGGGTLHFRSESPLGVDAATRVWLPRERKHVAVTDAQGAVLPFQEDWDAATSTLLVRHAGRPEGVAVSITW